LETDMISLLFVCLLVQSLFTKSLRVGCA